MGQSWLTVVCSVLFVCSHWEPVRASVAPVIEAIHGCTVYSDGPHWDAETGMLYFTDKFGCTVNRYDSNSTRVTSLDLGEIVSIIIPIKGETDLFLITLGSKLAVLCWDGESPTPTFVNVLASLGGPNDETYINDGKADAYGILWAGTLIRNNGIFDLVPGAGVLFSFSKRRVPLAHAKGMTAPNGIAWNVANTQFYVAEAEERVVYAFDFDLYQSLASNPRIIFDFKAKEVEGRPVGITIDSEDLLWIACMRAGQIIQIDPSTGDLLRTISIPSIQTTSVTFGGCNMDELYVTSSNVETSPEALEKYPAPGAVFRVTGVGAKGLPPNRVSL